MARHLLGTATFRVHKQQYDPKPTFALKRMGGHGGFWAIDQWHHLLSAL
jgi:hypothetical protein